MLVAYALSIFVVERLFHIVKPKLIKLPWFGAFWKRVVALREKTSHWVGQRGVLEPAEVPKVGQLWQASRLSNLR